MSVVVQTPSPGVRARRNVIFRARGHTHGLIARVINASDVVCCGRSRLDLLSGLIEIGPVVAAAELAGKQLGEQRRGFC